MFHQDLTRPLVRTRWIKRPLPQLCALDPDVAVVDAYLEEEVLERGGRYIGLEGVLTLSATHPWVDICARKVVNFIQRADGGGTEYVLQHNGEWYAEPLNVEIRDLLHSRDLAVRPPNLAVRAYNPRDGTLTFEFRADVEEFDKVAELVEAVSDIPFDVDQDIGTSLWQGTCRAYAFQQLVLMVQIAAEVFQVR